MQNNNLAPINRDIAAWIEPIYYDLYVVMKLYSVSIIHNELEADDIICQGFSELYKEFIKNSGSLPDAVYGKAFVIDTIINGCYAWLAKKAASIGEPVEAKPDAHTIVAKFERYYLLAHSVN